MMHQWKLYTCACSHIAILVHLHIIPIPSPPPSLLVQVTIVDPLNITKEFSSILANPVIATDVMTKIILHSDL